jgi:ABC-type transport system involved in multi-copper enzyme maturation permease subunit
MFNYIKAELYRIVHKKSFYLYFLALAVLYAAMIFSQRSGLNESVFLTLAIQMTDILPLAVGGFLFATIYNDDLGAKSLSSVIGFGLRKSTIIFSKLIIMIAMCAVITPLVFVACYGSFTLFGVDVSGQFTLSAGLFTQAGLLAIAYATVASIVVFGAQKATLAITAYIFLAVGLARQLMGLVLGQEVVTNSVGDLTQYLSYSITSGILSNITSGQFDPWPVVQYIIYIAAFMTISIYIFRKKELEF